MRLEWILPDIKNFKIKIVGVLGKLKMREFRNERKNYQKRESLMDSLSVSIISLSISKNSLSISKNSLNFFKFSLDIQN